MPKNKDPTRLNEIKGDVAVLLADEETWTFLPGCSVIIAPPGALRDEETGLTESKPVRRLEELNLEPPYGLIALDTLLRNLPLSKILEYRTDLKRAAPPEPRKEKVHGDGVRSPKRRSADRGKR